MKNGSAPRSGPRQRFRVAQITGDALNGELGNNARRPHKRTHLMPLLKEHPGDMPADEARSSGDKCGFQLILFHETANIEVLPIKLTRPLLKRISVIWIVCLIIASLQPFRAPTTRGRTSHKHQIEHVVVFGATALLLLALARTRKEEAKAIAGVICLATAIEISQFLIYRLPAFEWWDVREDTIGAAIALLIHQIWPFAVL